LGLGANTHRQLGISSVEETTVPVMLATKAHAIAAGYNHSWYIDDAGNLWGTGDNAYGQLDPENTAQIDTWQPLYESVDAVAAGKDFSLIISQGRLFAIGSNEYGQLGDWEK
jgi:alpha-tubulin suppressor-like RCC1 family protein